MRSTNVQLGNPVYFRLIPLTVDDALARGIIDDFQEENVYSSNRAGRYIY